MESSDDSKKFLKKRHVKFFLRCINALPGAYKSMDTSRMTVLFFALSGLDLLNSLDELKKDFNDIIDWIYALQILPDKDNKEDRCGFRGSTFLGQKFNNQGSSTTTLYDGSHIAMTYTALLSLLILGDDLKRVDKKAIIKSLKDLQLPNGSFYSTHEGSENDMRFLYCACCVCYILQDWSAINQDTAVDYINRSITYDYGISQGPQLEAHGGSTFCAVASLTLMGKLHVCFSDKQIERLKRWCLIRQKNGFQGRPNKPVDTCYSFWVGASLKLLDAYEMVNHNENHEFLLSVQHPHIGGFSKWADNHPDILHSYFGVCGLSLMNLYDIEQLSPALNVSERAYKFLLELHKSGSFNDDI